MRIRPVSSNIREEDVLFPVLESHDIVEPPQIMRLDHGEFRKSNQALYKLAHNHENIPFERHVKIFQSWQALKPGQTLRIINDHDPKPLHYQFEAEEKGKYEWQYEQQGPKDWIVKIKKL